MIFEALTQLGDKIVFNQALPDIFTGTSFFDFYGFLLPWIFTFAIVYGLLMKTDIFAQKKQVSVALAFVVAFFVTGLGGPQLAYFFTTIFGGASMFLAGILVIILFVGLLGYGDQGKFKSTAALVVVIIIGALLFISSTGTFFGGSIFIDSFTASAIFWILIIVVAIYLITREGEPDEGAKPTAPGK